jgi:hypothetical protein
MPRLVAVAGSITVDILGSGYRTQQMGVPWVSREACGSAGPRGK